MHPPALGMQWAGSAVCPGAAAWDGELGAHRAVPDPKNKAELLGLQEEEELHNSPGAPTPPALGI